jgi:hypothetical protein
MSTAVSIGRVGRSGSENSVGRAVDILSVNDGFGRAASVSSAPTTNLPRRPSEVKMSFAGGREVAG